MKQIHYRKGYKYQLACDYIDNIQIFPGKSIATDWISLGKTGRLVILKGYAWDGPSGPTIDTASFMRGSLVHDALYALMRMGLLSGGHRQAVDRQLKADCTEDGMWGLRVKWVYRGVRVGAASAALPCNVKKVLVAP